MKAGTTSLYYTLKDYPQIDASLIKDTKFFISKNCKGNWHKGIEWYKSQFSNNGLVNLEASTHYAKLPHYLGVPCRILNTLQNVKFIYLIRNPIDRAISHYFHNRLVDNEIIDINTEFSNINSKYYHYSDYTKQMIPYLKHFDRSNILVKNVVDYQDRNININELLNFIIGQSINNADEKKIQFRNSFKDLLLNNQDSIHTYISIINQKQYCSKISLARSAGLKKKVLQKMIFVMQEKYNEFSELVGLDNKNWIECYEEYL